MTSVLELLSQSSATSGARAERNSQVPAIVRLLPSLTDIAFLMPISFLFLKLGGARSLLGDGDTGWHIRTGEWILAHHNVPYTDIFSFSRPGAPWFAWEWLCDVVFALFFHAGGMAAVVALSTLIICLTSTALFRLIRRRSGNGLVAIALTLLATGGCAIHWLARPHLFTLLFFTLTLHITDRAAAGRPKLLAWLIPLTLLWTNLHAGFFVIFLVLACYIGANLLHAAIDALTATPPRPHLRATLPWLATALACLAVSFINPYGWHLHQHMLAYITDPYQLKHITEFQSMDFHAPVTIYFEPLMLGALLAAAWAIRQRRFAEVLLAIGWLHLALIAQRNLPLFAIAAAPLLAEGIDALLRAHATPFTPLARAVQWLRDSIASVDETDRIARAHLVSAFGFALLALLLLAPQPLNDRFISTYDPKSYPEKALSVLRDPATHRIFAEDEWGDYLIYRLYPAKKVFIDGRSDFYGDAFGEEYVRLISGEEGWNRTLDRYGIDTIVISPKFALTSTLKISPDWRVVYDDRTSLVFRRNPPESSRDRAIAKTSTRDLSITQPGT